jgi:hypothetical protein
MSTRTIIEINHDYIAEMSEKGQIGLELYRLITRQAYDAKSRDELAARLPGVRVLGSRHHSEPFLLEIA